MKIRANGQVYENTLCRGCMCHDMAMIFGKDQSYCENCGCPKTVAKLQELVMSGRMKVLEGAT